MKIHFLLFHTTFEHIIAPKATGGKPDQRPLQNTCLSLTMGHMFKRVKRGISAFFIVISLLVFQSPNLYAAQSAHYILNESTIGAGGLMQSSSASYIGQDSIGSLGVGQAASTNFQVQAGATTTSDPALAVSVNGTVNFTTFSAATPATATTTFTVLNYTTYGYVAQIVGNPPSSGPTTLSAMSTTGPSAAGTSQFGINLVANTSPISIGANPNNGQFGFGTSAQL